MGINQSGAVWEFSLSYISIPPMQAYGFPYGIGLVWALNTKIDLAHQAILIFPSWGR